MKWIGKQRSLWDFDAVLVDVPCSNTGVLRRRVDARWRLEPDTVYHLVERFLAIGTDRIGIADTVGYANPRQVAEMFAQGLVALITDVIKMVGFAAVLFFLSAKLALWSFAIVPVLAVAAFIFRLKVREAFRAVRVRIARIGVPPESGAS